MQADSLWTQVGSFGPYFATSDAAEVHQGGGFGSGGWISMADIVDDPNILEQRVAATRAALAQTARLDIAEVQWRMAASIAHLGLVARFVAPLMGIAVAFDAVVEVSLADAWWCPVLGGPYPLSFDVPSMPTTSMPPTGTAGSENVQEKAAYFAKHILAEPVRELTEAMVEIGGVAEGLLWGNVASGLNGAANMIASARPGLAFNAGLFIDVVLGVDPMMATAVRENGRFWRRSCCLMYRLPGAGYCGDCVLSPDAPKSSSVDRTMTS